MAYAKEFYVTVKSNDSMEYFPSNTPSDFYIKLPYSMTLGGDWDVAVSQVWIDKMWFNVEDAHVTITEITKDGTHTGENVTKQLDDGYYSDIVELLNTLNECTLLNDRQVCEFEFNHKTHKVQIRVLDGFKLLISPKLRDIIGCETVGVMGKQTLGKCVNLHVRNSLLYICTDIVSGQICSDTTSGVVKVVGTKQYNFGEVIYDCNITNYARIRVDSFDVIHIQIRDMEKDIIKNVGGKTVVQLHFRRG